MKLKFAHFAMREWQALRGSRGLWVGMLATGAVLGLIGPFGTDTSLTTLARLLYWTFICVLTFSTGYCLAGGLMAFAAARTWPLWLGIILGSGAASLVISAQVITLNALLFDDPTGGIMDLWVLGLNIVVIVVIITLAVSVIAETDDNAPDAKPAQTPRLQDRLPPEVKGELISLSVTDHYVHVTTQRGTHMLLMRLSDAIAETAPTPGFQIHRSHWVAQDAIEALTRSTRKSEVVLHSGARLPVSRTYLPQLKEAGFLPKNDG